jgi:hypothetical protein
MPLGVMALVPPKPVNEALRLSRQALLKTMVLLYSPSFHAHARDAGPCME